MPEAPEVEVVLRQLKRRIGKFRVIGGRSYSEKFTRRSASGAKHPPFPLDAQLRSMWRHGKWINFDFDAPSGPMLIQANLGMSGRFVLCDTRKLPKGVYKRNVKWFAHLETPSGNVRLVYVDPRGMGHLRMLDLTEAHLVRKADALTQGAPIIRLGPDVMSDWLDSSEVWKTTTRLKAILNSKKPIKQLLMDQSRIAGIGNIYASESCWHMRIHPQTRGCDLQLFNLRLFVKRVPKMLHDSVARGGTSFGDANSYRDSFGREGSNFSRLRVYGRAGQLCGVCKTPIAKIREAGRGTFFCPKCQETK